MHYSCIDEIIFRGALMATIYKQISPQVSAEFAWQAIVDVGALHQRLVAGFVVDTRLDGDTRTVTFANGTVIKEKIISIDHNLHRLAYTVVGGSASHYNASVQVGAVTDRTCEITWIIDLLPDEMAQPIGKMVEAGAAAMKNTLERNYSTAP